MIELKHYCTTRNDYMDRVGSGAVVKAMPQGLRDLWGWAGWACSDFFEWDLKSLEEAVVISHLRLLSQEQSHQQK